MSFALPPSVVVGGWPSDARMMRSAAARPDKILVDVARNVVMRDETVVRPRRRDLRIFIFIAARPIGAICSLESIIDHLWGDDENGGPDNPAKAVSLAVSFIRKWGAAIGVSIETWWGRGYLMGVLPSALPRPDYREAHASAALFDAQPAPKRSRRFVLAPARAVITGQDASAPWRGNPRLS
ncbi:hypothetical protein RZS28_09745 [Methylocapsa polymorpha]|uniref:OmpR/PhoB-type domain-containing protein n=1 Tax=Methylocapsa polymorpha TaxID=3080828 RepID=A0ABZ0HLX1_9HYPH|nr:hypothetical protein RZS28_09745 [Methylocapsa sp. RX1]